MDFICLAEREKRERDLAARYEASPSADANTTTLEQLRNYPEKKPALRKGISSRMPSSKALGFAGERTQGGARWYQQPLVGQLKVRSCQYRGALV